MIKHVSVNSQYSVHPGVLSSIDFGDQCCKESDDASSYADRISRLISASGYHSTLRRLGIFQKDLNCTIGQNFSWEIWGSVHINERITSIKCTPSIPSWVDSVHRLSKSGNEDASLREIAVATMLFKNNADFSELSKDLLQFDLENLPDVVLISLLRSTFSVRSELHIWDLLKENVAKLLQLRGRNLRILLRGL